MEVLAMRIRSSDHPSGGEQDLDLGDVEGVEEIGERVPKAQTDRLDVGVVEARGHRAGLVDGEACATAGVVEDRDFEQNLKSGLLFEAARGIEPMCNALQSVVGRLQDSAGYTPTLLTRGPSEPVNPRRMPLVVGYEATLSASEGKGR